MKLSILASTSFAALLLAGAAAAQEVADPVDLNLGDDYGAIVNSTAFYSALRSANDSANTENRGARRGNAGNQVAPANNAVLADGAEGTASQLITGDPRFGGFAGGYEGRADSSSNGRLDADGAGNKAGAEQDGDNNNSTINQQTGRTGWAVTNQRGDRNTATVTQTDASGQGTTGSRNLAYVGQIGGDTATAADTQTATITQTYRDGDRAPIGAVGYNAAVVIQGTQSEGAITTQAGRANTATISQIGAGQDATIEQGADAGGSSAGNGNNVATIRQGRTFPTNLEGNNEAVIQQKANGTASIQQLFHSHKATILQDEGTNTARLYQGGTLGQYGNFAGISQSGNHTANVDQVGAVSEVFVLQEAGAAGGVVEIQQGTNTNGRLLAESYASVVQTGTANNSYASILQEAGPGNSTNNSAFITQSNASFSKGIIAQQGGGNLAITRQ